MSDRKSPPSQHGSRSTPRRSRCPGPSSSAALARRSASCPGALKGFQAVDLGGIAITAALDKAGIGGDQVDALVLRVSA